jgi:hypothetical protein
MNGSSTKRQVSCDIPRVDTSVPSATNSVAASGGRASTRTARYIEICISG